MKNVMGIIIAVIGLAIFFAGVYQLYQVNKSQTVENARKTLDNIIGKIELLQDGENNTFVIQGFKGGDDWYLVGWSEGEEGRPDKCFFNSCVCVCKPDDAKKHSRENLAEGCQNNGFCRDINSPSIAVLSKLIITGVPPAGDILYPSCIVFGESVNEIFIMKKQPEQNELWKFGGYSAELMIFDEDFGGKTSCIDLSG